MINLKSDNLPVFPEFKLVALEDKATFFTHTSHFPPYSDFNFTSLWCYNTGNDVIISGLNENLVMLFRDYITNEPFYTFLGNNKPKETTETLLDDAKRKGLMNILKLIPEHNFLNSPEIYKSFDIKEDPDNYDYILSVEELCELPGSKYHSQRNHVSRFNREYSGMDIRILESRDKNVQKSVIDLFYFWEKQKNKKREDTEIELTAIKRLLKDEEYFELVIVGIYDKERLVGFTISDAVDSEYAMLSFAKADQSYFGIYQFLYNLTAKEFQKKGLKFINIEQDLGIPGLKFSKQQWNPIKYLKKYIIKSRDQD